MKSNDMAIFLVHTSLQALVCYLYIKNRINIYSKRTLVFLEGEIKMPPINGVSFIKIINTRGDKLAVKENIKLIQSYINFNCELWVSELIWQMNNALYSHLLSKDRLKSINFFDEGSIMYLNTEHSWKFFLRQLLKSVILKLYYPKYSLIKRKMYFTNKKNGLVLAINPNLIEGSNHNIIELEYDKDMVSKFLSIVEQKDAQYLNDIFKDRIILFLSQPYYRIISEKKFNEFLEQVSRVIDNDQSGNLYIKLHPSEKLDVYEKYYKKFGFKILDKCSSVPMEALLHLLTPDSVIVSSNSSLFFNARKFGFKGEIISVGLDLITKQVYYSSDTYYKRYIRLLKKFDCKIVLSKDI